MKKINVVNTAPGTVLPLLYFVCNLWKDPIC